MEVLDIPTACQQSYLALLEDYVRENHPRSLTGIIEARQADPARFHGIGETFLRWALKARGVDAIPAMVDSFVRFTTSVNLSQARYEADGHYENKSFAECNQSLYSQKDDMDDYLWGIYLTNFLWAHHFEICKFYQDRFLTRLPHARTLIEIAPGHGGWGVFALEHLPQAQLLGYDISPSSLEIATEISAAAGFAGRARYEVRDALDLKSIPASAADAVICSFLIEHLEEPGKLIAVVQHLLKPGGTVFLTGALTAAQVDHIHEFRRESEMAVLAEDHGLRVLETLSVGPKRLFRAARFMPRSMALILQKRQNDIY
jgi:SAM-dependent methyltransferase